MGFALGSPLLAQAPLRIVASSGQPAPGTGEIRPALFDRFSDLTGDTGPTINNAGDVAFSARIALPISPVDPAGNIVRTRGIWAERQMDLSLVAREGMPAPDTGAAFASGLREPVINDNGLVGFQASLTGSNVDHSLWIGGAGLQLVARSGQMPPSSAADEHFHTFDDPAFNRLGQMAFRGVLAGNAIDPTPGVNDRGIWTQGGGDGLRLGQRAGQLAPLQTGIPLTEARFTEFSTPVLNDLGEIAFRGTLVGTAVNSTNARGIWSEGGGAPLHLVAREGWLAPGTGLAFLTMGVPSINYQGHVAFGARLESQDGVVTGASGIWAETPAGLALVARSGQFATGSDWPQQFFSFGAPIIGDNGRVAFSATVAGPRIFEDVNDRGIWMTTRGGLFSVAQAGEQAPGVPAGVVFGDCSPQDFVPTMNARGQVAFTACLTGPGVAAHNNRGIFAMNTRGELIKIARTGEQIEVKPGLLQTIVDLRLRTGAGGGDGRGRSFNDRSELAFWAAFAELVPGVANEAIVVGGAIASTLSGDTNGDGVVDRYDLALLAEWWASEDFWEGDFDLDGKITVYDLGILQNNYGSGSGTFGESPSAAHVSEPGGLGIAVIAALATVLLRRRRQNRHDR
jgi:hypothetical protein